MTEVRDGMKRLMAEPDRIMPLLEKAKAGDRPAFDQIAEAFRGRLESFIRSRVRAQYRPRLGMDEIAQETFARAFESLDRFQGDDEDDFFGWLAGIAKNVVLKAIEKLQRNQALAIDRDFLASDISPSKDLRRNERFDRLQEAIRGLTGDYKEVVFLSRIEGLPLEKVAARMNRSPDAVKKLLWRALKQLKKAFGDTESLNLPDRSLLPEGGGHADEPRG
jgi:RNA polymerase sigma-70 factor, ECF subfamily